MNEIHDIVNSADAVMITAGAGMGVDSGLPDFRGSEGLWNTYPALREMRLDFQQMANPEWFVKKPELAWAFYGHRLHQYNMTKPHAGFDMLLDYVKSKNDNYFVVTSNVDGAFQKAGFDPMKIHEKHGAINRLQCQYECNHTIWPVRYESVVVDEDKFVATAMPKCPTCGMIARPNILMFGDYDWLGDREQAQRERFSTWFTNIHIAGQSIVIIEIGAGVDLPSIRQFSESESAHKNTTLIRINPRHPQVPDKPDMFGIELGGLAGIQKVLEDV